jgi:hypothetical protein
MTPGKSMQWLQDNMLPYFPVGVFKDPDIAETAAGLAPIPRRLGHAD